MNCPPCDSIPRPQGCSICWFNTVCFVLCIKNFPANRALALSLTVSYNGVSAAFTHPYPSPTLGGSSLPRGARLLLGGAIFLLIFPLCVPGVVYARRWFHLTVHSSFHLSGSGFILVDDEDLELHKRLLSREGSLNNHNGSLIGYEALEYKMSSQKQCSEEDNTRCCEKIMEKDQLVMLGEEHPAQVLVGRLDFWLYYLAYFCGGTIGLVYSNNLGQIAQSLGQSSTTTLLLTLYSSFSFFGRLLSAAPDYVRAKFYFARTGWLTIALLPTPVAFFSLAALGGSTAALRVGTSLIGLSSGFIFAAAVSITSELFGPNSVGVNHNILITNIPIGSLVYGVLAAINYDENAGVRLKLVFSSDSVVCMGRECYFFTFVLWGCLSLGGLVSSLLLFVRTKHAYDAFERNRGLVEVEEDKDSASVSSLLLFVRTKHAYDAFERNRGLVEVEEDKDSASGSVMEQLIV
ncbi:Protein NUCLEAR FUSION DEFECTIVE 4 [Hibiscus syriacus]|uniref:Protein NUCLEAR FUSION DEFECTIVE 4 n=1 Tax=Hibiscus syriacus TaxID=106335 RepID=A0A6A3CFI2_HIBSY|nr:Protein NUCLEAR FUSION DEFECTIVE 4 [Hibiscus syriacus]